MNAPTIRLDLYTKAVLTVIAVCLVWICLGGILRATPSLEAQSDRIMDVRVRAIARDAGARWDAVMIDAPTAVPVDVYNREPIPVEVRNEAVTVDVRNVEVRMGLKPLEKK